MHPIWGLPVSVPSAGGQCTEAEFNQPWLDRGEKSKTLLAANWLALHSRMAETVATIGKAVHQSHGTFGLVAASFGLNSYAVLNDTVLTVDAEPAFSVVARDNAAATRTAIIHTIASASSTLEAQALYELNPQPDVAAATSRLAWANSPPPPHGQTVATRAPENFHWIDASNLAAAPQAVRDRVAPWVAQGYRVLTPTAADLGPGRDKTRYPNPATPGSEGMPPQSSFNCCWVQTIGGTLIAVRDDAISYLTLGPSSGGLKGGSGVNVGPTLGRLDPADASADHVRKQAEESLLKTDVDLRSGDLSFSPPADISVGGSFPYGLEFRRTWRGGHGGSPGLAPGWSHGLDIRLSEGSSGMAGLGRTAPVHGSAGLAYLTALLEMFRGGVTPDRLLAGAVAGDWWLRRMETNLVTVVGGDGSGVSFVRRSDGGGFFPNAGGGDKLEQTGQRFLADRGPTDNLPTFWRYRNDNLSYRRTLADGSEQTFTWKDSCPFALATSGHCTLEWPDGLYIKDWIFKHGMKVFWTYDSTSNQLKRVANNLGRGLDFTYSVPASDQTIISVTDGNGRHVGLRNDYATSQGAQDFRALRHARRLVEVTNPAGEKIHYAQRDDAQTIAEDLLHGLPLLSVTRDGDAFAALTVTYDPWRRVATLANATGGLSRYAPGPRAGSWKDAVGSVRETWFDERGRPERNVDPLGRETRTVYDGLGRAVRQVDAAGGAVETEYDARGNVAVRRRVARPNSALAADDKTRATVERTTWHLKWNKPVTVTDALDAVTTFVYDDDTGVLKQVTAPAAVDASAVGTPMVSAVTRLEDYDAFGRVRRLVHPDGRVDTYSYAPALEVMTASVQDAGGLNLTTSYAWTPSGDLERLTDPRLFERGAEYDAARRLKAMSLPGGGRIEWDRNAKGWVEHVRRAVDAAHTTWADTGFGYDDDGRVTAVTDPLNRMTVTEYDLAGRPKRLTDPLGRVSETVYDAAGQVEAEKAAVGTDLAQESARYTRYADGQVSTITDPRGHVLRHGYDGFGRLSALTHPDGPKELYGYDANDNRTSLTQRDGTVSTTAYDKLNRPTGVTRPGLAVAGYGYDRMGRVVLESAGAVPVRRHTYDGAGRRLSSTITLPRPATGVAGAAPSVVMAFEHDKSGNRTKATWSGSQVPWEHDGLNRVTAVRLGPDPLPVEVASHVYDVLGRRTDTVRGGASSHYDYDLADQLTALSHGWPGGGLAATYHYDAAGQLDWERLDNAAFRREPPPTLSKTTTYDPASSINALTKVDGVAQSHDGRGNRTGAATRTWRYDSRNMLTGANAPGMAVSYGYYPEGGRAWKQVNGVTTLYLELDGIEWGSYDPAGPLKERTIRASGTGGAVVAVHSPTGGLIRLLPNRQGSVIGWLRPDGKLGGAYTYDAYGNSPQAGAAGPSFRYAGMRYDAETGLYHTPNRAYDPQYGRWMQLDPIGTKDGLNRYAYVRNSPGMGVDPSGLACFCGTSQDDRMAATGIQVGVYIARSETKVDDAIALGTVAVMAAPVILETAIAVRLWALTNADKAMVLTAGAAEGIAPGAGGVLGAGAVATAERIGAAASESVVLYRGIDSTHPGFANALKGIAEPRSGNASITQHVFGNRTASGFTSWTSDFSTAEYFATKESGSGVVLSSSFNRGNLITSPGNSA
ncbi:RHS repeat-associated core domain-containing protein [Niveispirillum sp. KHB5.9]|uniref:RHS repeat-associated core domain-containing protein n=1 Tax=Niveispirillum sp. KHB5.9 TaxID=3400269 RepID=UPI003A8C58FD